MSSYTSDIVSLFLKGVKDSLSIRQGIVDVLSSYELTKRTLQITLINGVLYLGSVWFFSIVLSYTSGESE